MTRNSNMSRDMDEKKEWEEDLDEVVHLQASELKSWAELQEQIKEDIQKGSKTLPMSKINQLVALRSFATLIVKGYGQIAASQKIACQ